MQIVFLARRFYPQIGGVEKHLMEISTRLIKQGHQVTIIAEKIDDAPSYDEIHHIQIYRIYAGKEDKGKKLRIWKEMIRLKHIIAKADVIHCHDVFFWYLPFKFLFPQKPVYTTFHGYESYPITQKAISIRKLSEKLSSGNICIGDFITKWYNTNPTIVSYGGVDIPKEHYPKPKPNSALFYGRLDEQTGIAAYAQVVEEIKKVTPAFDFLIVGDGEYSKKLKDFTVKPFQESPEKYFKKYRFAFLSRYLSILEAFAAKRLVFAVYDNSVKEDYLKMTPYAKFMVIEKDPIKLADKVMYYQNHPKEEEMMVQQAYEWVKDQTWDNVVNTYLKLWKQI